MTDGSDREEAVRDAVEVSQSGAPAGGHTIRDRFAADEIFQTTERRLETAREGGPDRQLSVYEWVVGGVSGSERVYVTVDEEPTSDRSRDTNHMPQL